MPWNKLAWPLAALPAPLGFAWASFEVEKYEGWGQWAAAPLLLAPLGYGLLVALAAAVVALLAWRDRRPIAVPLVAVLFALPPWLVVLVRKL